MKLKTVGPRSWIKLDVHFKLYKRIRIIDKSHKKTLKRISKWNGSKIFNSTNVKRVFKDSHEP